jgi:hypothetical protein
VGAADADALADRGIETRNVMGLVTTGSLELLSGLLDSGEITIPEVKSFPLTDAGDALAAVATSHVRGKIVVTMV